METVTARICREAGGRVTTNVMVRDLDLAKPHVADTRRLEVVVDGLPVFGGAQLARHQYCAHPMPTARREMPMWMGQHSAARRREEKRTYPELIGRPGRARLVVLVVECCGRWSVEPSFLSSLARAKVRSLRPSLQKRAEQAWRLRWVSLISCTVAHAVAMSLLGLLGVKVADGQCPLFHDVERDFRPLGLDPSVFA